MSDENNSPKGKILVRMPPHLHSSLKARAKEEGVSLNTIIVELLDIHHWYYRKEKFDVKNIHTVDRRAGCGFN